uniref:Condensin complex subunit 2 n=1 Tax=Glossina austeni TaxID=7395 RepID=A0A1A9ULT9_GLOAU
MTSDHKNSPITPMLNVSLYQESNINDNAEKRRKFKRRTLTTAKDENVESSFTESGTLQNELEFYNNNKLGLENAWSFSLIDTLSILLFNHHKTVNDFIMAGYCLEASSKIYSVRVDSTYSGVYHTLAVLNAQKLRERQVENVDDGNVNEECKGVSDLVNNPAGLKATKKNLTSARRKRKRTTACTVTKNKETLNACLDTGGLLPQDPVFAKFNSMAGFSKGLMNNILLTTESELKLHTTFVVWDKAALPARDYTEEISLQTYNENELSPCDPLFEVQNLENLKLRPLQSGYIITDEPEPKTQAMGHSLNRPYCTDSANGMSFVPQEIHGREIQTVNSPFDNVHDKSMAFDMDGECEPIPMRTEQALIDNVSRYELNGLTREERTAINNCRSLRKSATIIEDLRPVDTSYLEYSYRPLNKISHFWAGPMHWKFERIRYSCASEGVTGAALNPRASRPRRNMHRKKAKQLTFDQLNEKLFVPLDEKYKNRKLNVKKNWDHKELKFPIDMQLTKNRFSNFTLAPGLALSENAACKSTLHNDIDSRGNVRLNGMGEAIDDQFTDDHEDRNGFENLVCNSFSVFRDEMRLVQNNSHNSTILEIPIDLERVSAQVTRVTVPFARRSKVIDMDRLKRICLALLNEQLKKPMHGEDVRRHPILNDERYEGGMASFNEIYAQLPKELSKDVSTSIAFNSILHLANEQGLRLIPQEDLTDLKIRKLAN